MVHAVRAASPIAAPAGARPAPAAAGPVDSVQVSPALPLLENPDDAVTVLARKLGYAEFPQASPDGRQVLFNVVSDYTTSQMLIMDADGGNLRSLFTGEPLDRKSLPAFLARHKDHIDEQGTWSPDGRSILYRSNTAGKTFDIKRFDLETGSSTTAVADPGLNLKHPVQLSDGRIVGYGGPPGPQYATVDAYDDVWIADPRTGEVRFLTESRGEAAYKHASEMDGRIVVHKFSTSDPEERADLVSLDPATGQEVNLTASPDADDRHPFYNEARGLLACHSDETGDKNLWIATPGLSRKVQLTFYGKAAQSPAWSPDGRTLYFVKKHQRQGEGEPFYARLADIRALDVKAALKDLASQARRAWKELRDEGAPPESVQAARQRYEDYRFFLRRYE